MKKRRLIKIYWILLLSGIISFFFLFILTGNGYFGEMPEFEQLENPNTNLATQIISSDGEILGKYYFNDNRTPITYKELPSNLVNALIATEDERFYSHPGIDVRSTLRAIVFLNKRGGASTISQQLARQLFVGVRSRSFAQAILQKAKEWVLALQIEKRYTKNEIIAMYLNIYDFGNNADGVRSASKIYLNKTPDSLLIEDAAMLVGMLKNSSLYNPLRRPELVLERRNVVFQQMFRNEMISTNELDSLVQLPLNVDYSPESHREGLATYFRAYLQEFMNQWLRENIREDGSKYNLYRDGLRIYTTIDSRLQEIAEQSMDDHMKNLQSEFFAQNKEPDSLNPTPPFRDLREGQVDTLIKLSAMRSERWRKMRLSGNSDDKIWESFQLETPMKVFSWKGEIDTIMKPVDSIRYYKYFLRSSLMSMEPQTGHVKAWVGGFDFKHFQYDQVKQGRRQIGSTVKPFLYATAIDQLKLSPCHTLPDALYCIEPMKHGNIDAWCPKNSSNKYGQTRNLKNALANSINTVSARLMDQVGPKPVVTLMKKMGIKSYLPEVPSIALGTPDISLYELVGAYSTFVNKGIYVEPIFITRIEDKNGTPLFEVIPETRDVLSEEVAYVTLNLLEGVTNYGSGGRLRHAGLEESNYIYKNIITGYPYVFENAIAGKTGTTQNQSDGWFMGMVPNLVTGVWVGGEDRSVHFEDIAFGQGATMALPIWAQYMKNAYLHEDLNISSEDFPVPEFVSIPLDCASLRIDSEDENKDLKKLGF